MAVLLFSLQLQHAGGRPGFLLVPRFVKEAIKNTSGERSQVLPDASHLMEVRIFSLNIIMLTHTG